MFVVGTATRYGMDGPGIESWWGRDFPHLSRPALGPTQSSIQWVPRLSRGKAAGAWPWPPTTSNAEVIERVELYIYSPLLAFMACDRVIFTFTCSVVTACCGLLGENRRFGVVYCHIFEDLYKAICNTELLALTYSTTILKIKTNSFFRSELNGVILGPGKIKASERRDENLLPFFRIPIWEKQRWH
jgi:hypothetical protein